MLTLKKKWYEIYILTSPIHNVYQVYVKFNQNYISVGNRKWGNQAFVFICLFIHEQFYKRYFKIIIFITKQKFKR